MVQSIGEEIVMRHERYRVDRSAAVELFARAEVMHLATTGGDGQPILRALHGVVVGDALVWHGAPKGEKSDVAGRTGVVSCESIVAIVPSYFIDPELACPATTYYESAQAAGTIEAVEDPDEKAAALTALMARYQPEGGFLPIDTAEPRYANVIRSLGLWRVPLTNAVGKRKLGQNRKPEQMRAIVEGLWRRGGPRDIEAIRVLLDANPHADTPRFLAAPEGFSLCLPGPADASDAVALVRDAYWNVTNDDRAIRAAHFGSGAWVGARDAAGRLVATARAITDGGKNAWVYDVLVAPEHRGRRLGEAVMRMLLDHPAVRNVRRVLLGTLDAQSFYRRLGFEVRRTTGPTPNTQVMMLCPGDPACTSDLDGAGRRNAS